MKQNLKVPEEVIMNKIFEIRGKKVMLDKDLATLYHVETKQLKRQVRRNIERFPDDFMFELSTEELEHLRSQYGTSSWGGARYIPMVFTEQGISMLSSVLTSQIAINVNIQIIRTFTNMRKMLLTHKDLLLEMEEIRKNATNQDEKIELIFNYLQQFIQHQEKPKVRVGFK